VTDSADSSIAAPTRPAGRLAFIDALRALASQLIVWHHLATYGPLGEALWQLLPAVWQFLYSWARMAVQVFLVIGGFVVARGFAGDRAPKPRTAPGLIAKRWLRLGLPYFATIALAVGANAFARCFLVDDAIGAPATWQQLLAHALFLQEILDYEGVSAGLWYVAIDFQLWCLVVLVFALSSAVGRALDSRGQKGQLIAQGLFGALALGSLFAVNRNPDLDIWAIYFFASYFLGMALQWSLSGKASRWLFWGFAALCVVALVIDFRPRLVVALATAFAIWATQRFHLLETWPRSRAIAWLGRISFSLFLVHFPVLLVANAGFARLIPDWPIVAIAISYLLALGAGALFYYGIEHPVLSWQRRRARVARARLAKAEAQSACALDGVQGTP
jgi:peptidoglycan/LPS O-acetylase OafA/YrhL